MAVMGDVVLTCARRAAGMSDSAPARANTVDIARALDLHRLWAVFAQHGPDVLGVDQEIVARARATAAAQRANELRTEADLAVVASALDGAGIPWVCVKGLVLAAVYRRAGAARAMVDLDLLVPPADFRAALQALGGAGVGLINRNFALLRRELPAEVVMLSRHGTVVDLHWNLVHRQTRRATTRVSTEQLLARSGVDERIGPGVRTLAPEAALAHVCLHAAAGGGTRLSWLLDVALSVADRPVDWPTVVDNAQAWGAGAAIGLVLERSRRVLGADVPDGVVHDLVGRSWLSALRALEGRPGRRSDREDADVAWLVRSSMRETSPFPALAAVALDRARRGGRRRTPFRQSAEDPGSALHAAGTTDDLAAYLDAVVGQR